MKISQIVELKKTNGSLRDLITTAIFQGNWEGLVGIHNLEIKINDNERSNGQTLAEGTISVKLQFEQSFKEFSGIFYVVGYTNNKVDLGFDELEINIEGV